LDLIRLTIFNNTDVHSLCFWQMISRHPGRGAKSFLELSTKLIVYL